ncbi:TcpD family membrane protein [Crossiella sp. SN42]|uniref:TcpD family membrane protein n=1 Tax=Crossiella sp. SN42 TaxID=2944808 RepID=UPI00207CCE99|nr:TcpD family membrane protein [Crossiella sp. SN42]MCO1575579.1 TcpD family membrane protein [Crossiella sp. SN42]
MISIIFAADLALQLKPTSGVELRNILLGVMASLIAILMAYRAMAAYAAGHYGQMVTSVLAGALAAGFVVFPDQAMTVVKGLWTAVFGG